WRSPGCWLTRRESFRWSARTTRSISARRRGQAAFGSRAPTGTNSGWLRAVSAYRSPARILALRDPCRSILCDTSRPEEMTVSYNTKILTRRNRKKDYHDEHDDHTQVRAPSAVHGNDGANAAPRTAGRSSDTLRSHSAAGPRQRASPTPDGRDL